MRSATLRAGPAAQGRGFFFTYTALVPQRANARLRKRTGLLPVVSGGTEYFANLNLPYLRMAALSRKARQDAFRGSQARVPRATNAGEDTPRHKLNNDLER